jgi:hypothetical protein
MAIKQRSKLDVAADTEQQPTKARLAILYITLTLLLLALVGWHMATLETMEDTAQQTRQNP